MIGGYESRIELGQLLAIVHQPTEALRVSVVPGEEGCKDKIKAFDLTHNAFNGDGYRHSEAERLLKYYAKAPVWNVTAKLEEQYLYDKRGYYFRPILVCRVNWIDIRDAYYREQEDIRKAKRKEYRDRKKAEQSEGSANKRESD